MPLTIFHDDVIAGRLVPLLTEWGLQRLKINIAYPTRRHLPAKERCCDVRVVNIQARNLCVRRRPQADISGRPLCCILWSIGLKAITQADAACMLRLAACCQS